MKLPTSLHAFALAATLFSPCAEALGQEGIAARPEVQVFIREMVRKHRLDGQDLNRLFQQVTIQDKILDAITHPAEAKPWHVYRKIFLTETRIQGGLSFWDRNRAALVSARNRYGVPPEMVIAIIGIETNYGQNAGHYRVIDALSTLAFDYPQRARFFRSELADFLLLCREERIDPALPRGSYAGAMGMPQFMPSSYRRYAADLDGDRRRDIWGNAADAIASVANYFSVHGWQSREPIAVPASVRGNGFHALLNKDLRPSHLIAELRKLGVEPRTPVPDRTRAKLLELGEETGPSYWLTLQNFYVISRYNHSPLYAMAAYQLSRELLARRGT
jgi:membrane-bound lytic murein transglycosylase B